MQLKHSMPFGKAMLMYIIVSLLLFFEMALTSIAQCDFTLNNMAVVISGAIFQPLIGWLLRELNFLHAIRYRYVLLAILAAYVICFLMAWYFIKDPSRQKSTYQHQTAG